MESQISLPLRLQWQVVLHSHQLCVAWQCQRQHHDAVQWLEHLQGLKCLQWISFPQKIQVGVLPIYKIVAFSKVSGLLRIVEEKPVLENPP